MSYIFHHKFKKSVEQKSTRGWVERLEQPALCPQGSAGGGLGASLLETLPSRSSPPGLRRPMILAVLIQGVKSFRQQCPVICLGLVCASTLDTQHMDPVEAVKLEGAGKGLAEASSVPPPA